MYIDPNGTFVITLSTVLIGMAIGAALGGTIGLGSTVYKDYKDDGKIFNGSVVLGTYLGNTLGGTIAGAGVGVCAVLGAAAGTAALVGSSATLFTAGGVGITFGSALAIGTGAAFVTGMAGYAVRSGISSEESFNLGTMFAEGGFNALSGAFSVAGGYLIGVTGFRADYVSKLLSRKSDLYIRPIIQAYSTGAIKLGISSIKQQLLY
jgi:hypothetical protein